MLPCPKFAVALPAILATLLSGGFGRTMAAEARSADPEAWTLERAVAYAIANHPDARTAQLRIGQARAGLQMAESAFWPHLRASASYTSSDSPPNRFGFMGRQANIPARMDFNNPPAGDNLNVGLTGVVSLYNGGRDRANLGAAKAGLASATQMEAAVTSALAFEVARAFHSVLKARDFIATAESAVRSYESHLEVGTRRLNAGTALKTEVLDLEVRLAEAREGLLHARNGATLSERVLRHLLALESGEITVASGVPEVPVPKDLDYSRRPELQALAEQVRARNLDLRAAEAGCGPRVNAFAVYENDQGLRRGGGNLSWTTGLSVEYDVFDAHLTGARSAAARSALASAREDERKVRLGIILDVEQANLSLKDAEERLAVTAKAVESARQSTELTQARFDQGLSLATQVIDAESALTAVRVRHAQAVADRRIAVAALRQALGLPQVESVPASP